MNVFKNPFDIGFNRLPDSLPIFPHEGALLLPGGQVPLHMFEPRYLNMVQDALAAQDRLIGMVLPDLTKPKIGSNKRPLYEVGCAGRITSFEETSDGRFLIMATGYCRFRLGDEVPTMRGYRRVSAKWDEFEEDLTIDPHVDIDRDKLIDALQAYAELASIEMDWSSVARVPNFNLITFFAMSLFFENEQKQQLIEAKDLVERADVLLSLISSENTRMQCEQQQDAT